MGVVRVLEGVDGRGWYTPAERFKGRDRSTLHGELAMPSAFPPNVLSPWGLRVKPGFAGARFDVVGEGDDGDMYGTLLSLKVLLPPPPPPPLMVVLTFGSRLPST